MGNRAESLLLTRRQVGDALGGVCTKTVSKLIREGELPARRIGRKVFVSRQAVQEFVDEGHAGVEAMLRKMDGDEKNAGVFKAGCDAMREKLLNPKKGK